MLNAQTECILIFWGRVLVRGIGGIAKHRLRGLAVSLPESWPISWRRGCSIAITCRRGRMLNCVDIINISHCGPASLHRDHAVPLVIFSGTDTHHDYSHYDKEHYSPNGRTSVSTRTVVAVIVVRVAVVVPVIGIVITGRRQARKTKYCENQFQKKFLHFCGCVGGYRSANLS